MFFNENRYLEVREVGNKFFEYGTHQYGPFICMFEGHPLTRQEISSTFLFLNVFYCKKLMERHYKISRRVLAIENGVREC